MTFHGGDDDQIASSVAFIAASFLRKRDPVNKWHHYFLIKM